jgi:hypothetical protein
MGTEINDSGITSISRRKENRMKRLYGYLALCAFALVFAACSSKQDPIKTMFANIAAADCVNPQQFVNNLPLVVGSPALVTAGLQQICTGMFGTVAAPTPAPGNTSVFSAAPAK